MTIVATQFDECRPTVWSGRYARIPGDCTVFHLHHVGGRLWPVILWEADGRATCKAVECDAAADLAESVGRAKRFAGGNGTGSFVINEFGQVLVPASEGSGRRYLAGRLTGRLLFENPFCPDELIDLGDDDRLQPGDPWKLPYLGVPYNLHRDGMIYFYKEDESGGRMTFPPRQDQGLIRAIRSIRPTRAVRFIVNHAGLVLTKCGPEGRSTSEESWQPVYVGSITPNLWFEKE
jgi:hypothetical protein